ncbi:MAG: tyrosine-type recombinase/integrase [Rhodocyclaceae bacterium]|nr:tyrosine-type recombinase/integrase [Rhodocyclaceae bacterium]
MPAQALSAEFMATLPCREPASGAVSYFDTEIKGFLLEHRASGGMTYYFRYRDASAKVRMHRVGRADEVSLADARAKAHKMRQMVAEGGDPKLESHRFRDVPSFGTFVAERYLPYAKTRKRSWKTDEIMLRNHLLPVFAELRMNRVTRSDVVAFHHAVKEKGYAAGTCNRMLVLMRFIYNCAIRWDILPTTGNPCVGVEPFEDNGARERYLSQEEVGRLFDELDTNRNVQVGQVIRLLLYTGARKREVLDARWDEIDFNRRLLTVPAARSKSKKPRYIPLSDAAIELLRSLPRREDIPWVFFNPRTKKPPVSIFCAWDSIRKKVGLAEVRLHDLRHSYASFLVNAGRSLYEVQKLLGHYDPKVTMRYAHLSPGALLEAVNVVGELVGRRAGVVKCGVRVVVVA